MNISSKRRLTVDEYLDWAQAHPGRYELYDGNVYAMSPDGAGHAKIKFAVQTALVQGIKARGLPCHMLPDGMTVRVEAKTAYEPDALIYCGEEVDDKSFEVPNPLIIVEVLSPSTRHIDTSFKLGGYFRLPSVMHYLIIDPTQRFVLHHAREDNEIVAHIIRDGVINLDPPGLEIAMDDIYRGR